MNVNREELQAAALDARLSFSPGEEEALRETLQGTLKALASLKEELGPVEHPPLFSPQDIKNAYRQDRQEEPLPREAALLNGPDTDSSCFHVPRIIEG